MTIRASEVYRDYATDGVPASGTHDPVKEDIRTLLTGGLTGFIVAREGTPFERFADYVADGVNDDATIETAASALHALGGGVLYLAPAQDWDLGTSGVLLSALDNIHIVGGGGKSTRLIKAAGFGGNGGIVFAACNNCSVRGVYIDSNNQDGHGIAAGPTSLSLATGTPSTNIVVEDCYIEIQPIAHNYGTFFLQVQGGSIRNNVVDGMTTNVAALGEQEAIETFGGSDIEVCGNRIRRIKGNALSITNFPGFDTPSHNINFHDNFAENCSSVGWINITQGDGGFAGAFTNHASNISMSRNYGREIYTRGFILSINSGDGTDSGLTVKGIHIKDNECRFSASAAVTDWAAFTCIAQVHSGTAADPADFTVDDVVHSGNLYDEIPNDMLAASILVVENVSSEGNTYNGKTGGTGTLGIFSQDAPKLSLIGETIRRTQINAILCDNNCDDTRIEQCLLDDWDMDDLGSPAIGFEIGATGSGVTVRDNLCDMPDITAVNLVVFGSPANFTEWYVGGNRYIGTTADVLYEMFPVTTMGANGNRGQHTMAGGLSTITLTNKQIYTNSDVPVRQRSGTPQAVTLTVPANGSAVITLAAATDGSVYDWFIR